MVLQDQSTVTERSEVVKTAKSELPIAVHGDELLELTSLATEPRQKSNGSVQAHGLQVVRPSLNLKMIAQKPLFRNRSHVGPQQEASARRNNERRNVKKNVLRPQAGGRGGQNEGRETVR